MSATQTAELTASDDQSGDELGYSVAISGTTIVTGAPRHDAESTTADFGAAYVFGPASGAPPVVPPPVVPPPVVPPPVAHPTAKVRSISGGHAKITVALSCPSGPACARASLKATVKEHLKGRKITAITAAHKPKKVRTTTKQVVVAAGGVTLAAGTKKTLTLRLNATGRELLSRFGELKAIVTVSAGGKVIKRVTVTVLQSAKPKKKKK